MPEEKGSRPGNSPRRKQNTNRKQGIAVPMGSVILEKFTLQTRTVSEFGMFVHICLQICAYSKTGWQGICLLKNFNRLKMLSIKFE